MLGHFAGGILYTQLLILCGSSLSQPLNAAPIFVMFKRCPTRSHQMGRQQASSAPYLSEGCLQAFLVVGGYHLGQTAEDAGG